MNLPPQMTAALESLIVALIVLAFAWRAVRQLLPGVHRSLSGSARRLMGLSSEAVVLPAAGCDSGCGPCNGCGKTAPVVGKTTAAEHPIEFAPRKR